MLIAGRERAYLDWFPRRKTANPEALSAKCLRNWRTRDDSNVRPLPSEGNALSS